MTWPLGTFEPSVAWWKMGEENRQVVIDAISLLGVAPVEVRSASFYDDFATFIIIHRHNGHAHLVDHCESPAVMHADADGTMVCSCGRRVGEGHFLCTIEQTVRYPD